MDRAISVFKDNSSHRILILATLLGIAGVCLEAVFDVPLKMPGHRALPGAMALLVFFQVFAPWLLLALAAAVSLAIVATGMGAPMIVVVWIVTAVLLAAMSRKNRGNTFWFFLVFGLLFGLLRCASGFMTWHHTPGVVRLGGHLLFGAFGGFLAWGTAKIARITSKMI